MDSAVSVTHVVFRGVFPAASLKGSTHARLALGTGRFPRGIPRGLIEGVVAVDVLPQAGVFRGVFPAASLKQHRGRLDDGDLP